MVLYIMSIDARQERSQDSGRSNYKIDVEFLADEEGMYALSELSLGREPVSIVPGVTGYAQQCRRYEERIAELEKQRDQANKERDDAVKNTDPRLRVSLEVATRSNGTLLQALLQDLERYKRRIDVLEKEASPMRYGVARSSYLLSSGKVMVQASSPAGTPSIEYPAPGVVRRTDGKRGEEGQFLRVVVGGWEVVAEGVDGPIYEGDDVVVSRLSNGALIARKSEATSTGKKAAKRGEKTAPARFNVLELDEDE